jgi:PAS domain S-box-containing protein
VAESFWQPSLLWVNVVSGALITACCCAIALVMFFFLRRRPDLKPRGLILMFAVYISTRIVSLWNVWHSTYGLEVLVEIATVGIAIAAAIVAIRAVPAALKLTTPAQLEKINATLRQEMEARKQAEQQLSRHAAAELIATQDKMHAFFEGASQGILGVSSDGRILMVNRRTEELFGYSRAELLGQELEQLLPDRFRSSHVGQRNGYFAEPRIRTIGAGMNLAGRRKNGSEFPLEIGLSHVNTPEGPLAFGMVSDISERKKAADDLERANEELRRSNTEMEQFAHIASHDLQEPLRMVIGYLQLIERRYGERLDASGKEFIDFAVDGAKRMKVLIRDLLEFSRAGTDAASFREIDTPAILDYALHNLKTAIDESATLITADPLPSIVGDPVLLTQVFQNLIANAIKFQKGAAPRVHVSAQRQGPEWIFSVRDNGIGIESRHLNRIFRIFERLHSIEEYTGSGIGLAITRKIVERHQGRIWVESQPGAGSTFFFSLPAETVIVDNEPKLGLSATP